MTDSNNMGTVNVTVFYSDAEGSDTQHVESFPFPRTDTSAKNEAITRGRRYALSTTASGFNVEIEKDKRWDYIPVSRVLIATVEVLDDIPAQQ